MSDATFTGPDLNRFCGLDELGLEVVGQRLESDRAVLACRVTETDQWCRRCGCEGSPRDTLTRRLAHEPFGWRPTTLLFTVRRYRCTGCGHVSDMVEYHVVRQGVDDQALKSMLASNFDAVRIDAYWSTQSPALQALGAGRFPPNTFGIVAVDRRPDISGSCD